MCKSVRNLGLWVVFALFLILLFYLFQRPHA
jgi:hypothetical protein